MKRASILYTSRMKELECFIAFVPYISMLLI